MPATTSVIQLPPWARVNGKRRTHIQRVAAVVTEWADQMDIPERERARWLQAVAFHDALKDADKDLLIELAPDAWGAPVLRHGPAAAEMAARCGEVDRGVLDAVRYHSIGFAGWDAVGKILYLADYLEPGRRFLTGRHEKLRAKVPADMERVLRRVAAERIASKIQEGFALPTETTEFWNALVREQ